MRRRTLTFLLVASAVSCAFGIFGLWGRVRTVDGLALAAGGFGLGAWFVVWLRSPRSGDAPPAHRTTVPKSGA